MTNVRPEGDLVAHGFLRRDGTTVSLAGGERRVERDPREGRVTRLSLIRWERADTVAWGEDQDMWPVHRWARAH